jgi:hypothetical protein
MASVGRLAFLSCAVLTLSMHARAQIASTSEPSPAEKLTREWLHSGEPLLVAWGAHEALLSRNPYLDVDLLSLASEWEPLLSGRSCDWACPELTPEQKERRFAMAAVLDALIQLHVTVPADTLHNLAADFENAAAILLARLPIEDAASLSMELYRSPPGRADVLRDVSAALLAQHPTTEFAEDLLADTTIQATIVVLFPGDGFGSGRCGGAYFLPAPEVHEKWPQIGQYKLSKESRSDSTLIVGGIDPIYATREESNNYLGNEARGVALAPEQRRRLIAQMLGVSPEEIPWKTFVETTIQYQSLEQFHIALSDFVDQQQQMYRATVEQLKERDLIQSSDVLRSLPMLQLTLMDMRGEERTEALPKDAKLPDRVVWSR